MVQSLQDPSSHYSYFSSQQFASMLLNPQNPKLPATPLNLTKGLTNGPSSPVRPSSTEDPQRNEIKIEAEEGNVHVDGIAE